MSSSLTEVSIPIMTKASYREGSNILPFIFGAISLLTAGKGRAVCWQSERRKGNCHSKMYYIFRCNRAKQLPWSVGQWGLPLQVEHALFSSTFQKSMIFKKLAKMTVENLSKSAKFCNRLPTDCHPKMATYDNSSRIATRNAPFSGEPLHFISG